jgi:hypothetical protein
MFASNSHRVLLPLVNSPFCTKKINNEIVDFGYQKYFIKKGIWQGNKQ